MREWGLSGHDSLARRVWQAVFGPGHPVRPVCRASLRKHPAGHQRAAFFGSGGSERSNGLRKPSQVMADKGQTIPREKIGEMFGHMAEEDMLAVGRVLAVSLGVV